MHKDVGLLLSPEYEIGEKRHVPDVISRASFACFESHKLLSTMMDRIRQALEKEFTVRHV